MTDDAALVAAALAGGPEAYAPIIERYKDTVFAVALGRLGHPQDAEDVAQSTLVEGWERLASLRDPQRLGPWLRSIAVHRCIDLVRQAGRRAEQARAHGADHPDAAAVAGLGEAAVDAPDAALERAETRRRVLDAVGGLSPTLRETVTLYYLGSYALAEVARILQVPAGTVKYRLHAARQKLSEELLSMVEEVLHEEAPTADFADRVFTLLNRYEGMGQRTGGEALREVMRIAADGVPGFQRALRVPHASTRRWVFTALGASRVPVSEETVAMVKQGLRDPSKKVRRRAASVLMRMELPEARRQEEFMPLVAKLLFDPSRTVRRFAANQRQYRFPLEVVVAARAREPDEEIRRRLERLAEWLAEGLLREKGGLPAA